MIVILVLLVYALLAAVAMFFAVKWNKVYRVIDDWDFGMIVSLVSIFWPVAFPVYTAYIFANVLGRSE